MDFMLSVVKDQRQLVLDVFWRHGKENKKHSNFFLYRAGTRRLLSTELGRLFASTNVVYL